MAKKFFSIETYSDMTGEITDITTSTQLGEKVTTFDEIQNHVIQLVNDRHCRGCIRNEFGQRVLDFNWSQHCENGICFALESEDRLNAFVAAHPDKEEEPTPLQKRYAAYKQLYPNTFLLFRIGDFYESYGEDAVEAARVLGITLTHRNRHGRHPEPGDKLAGFPRHALDMYLPKLIRAGHRVIICDEVDDRRMKRALAEQGIGLEPMKAAV